MSSNNFEHSRNFFGRKTKPLQNRWDFLDCISDIVPFRERGQICGSMPNENTQVMHPSGGEQHVIVERLAFRQPGGELIKTRLMAEFVGRVGLFANIIHYRHPVVGLIHKKTTAASERLVT